MNEVVLRFKKGNKIHIKESLKGSFTRWCGGNVTSECILRGKNSSNPKIRKKATFADNARHFKHRLGGSIKQKGGTLLKYLFGGQSPLLNPLGISRANNVYKAGLSAAGKYIKDRITGKPDSEREAGLYYFKNLNKDDLKIALDAAMHSTQGGEVMSGSDMLSIGISNYFKQLMGIPINKNYTGNMTDDNKPNLKRDLVNLYLKGDTSGFEDVTDDEYYHNGPDYKRYFKKYYPNVKPRTYKMSSDGIPLELTKEELDYANKNLNKTIPVNLGWAEGGDNVGHANRWFKNINGKLYAIDSDVWDFNSKDWRWEGDDNKIADKAGTPFILKSIRPVRLKKKGGSIKTANARKWKHLNGGIIKALFGTDLDVDTRSDTTRKGKHEGIPTYGAANASNTAGLWDLLNYNITSNPNIITGEPTILPGRVNMSLYKNAKYLLKGPLNDEGFVNFVERLAQGKINPKSITKNGTVSPANYNYVDLKSESIPKGFTKGNEVTPSPIRNLAEEELSIRTVSPQKLENIPLNESEMYAYIDWLKDRGYKVPSKLETWANKLSKPILLTSILQTPKKTNALRAKEWLRASKEDKSNGVSRQSKDRFKEAEAYSTNDARRVHVAGRGNSKVSNSLLVLVAKNIDKYPKSVGQQYRKLRISELKMLSKGAPDQKALKNVRKQIRELLRNTGDTYGYYKFGGNIIKFLEGSTIINNSPIVMLHLLWLLNLPDYLAKKEELKRQKQLLEFLLEQLKQDIFGSILGTAGNFLLNYLSKPKNDNIQQTNSV